MSETVSIHELLQDFAEAVSSKMGQLTAGEPEDQLRGPFETLMKGVGDAIAWDIVCTGETPLPDRLGRPDYAVHHNQLLTGYVELKAPGVGAIASRFKGHNRQQFKRFSAVPNILYTDGNEWAVYRNGDREGKVVRIAGDVVTDGADAFTDKDATSIERLLRGFLEWEPFIPTDKKGRIKLQDFAELLAPLCRMLRDDVTEALGAGDSPLLRLADDWRQLLFPQASDEQFADAYAQTVTFALLLGRSEGADPLDLQTAEDALEAEHNLLSRALQVLTDAKAYAEMEASVDLLQRVIGAVPPATFAGPRDPWLYFYEQFLAVYDRNLRKDAGAYYTPVEVVRCQVRLIDDLLVNRLGKSLGFAASDVVTLDPAVGTGTYLLGVIEHALERVEEAEGKGAVENKASTLARNLYGFEIMVGPYAVSELRVSRALRDRGGSLPKDGSRIYLTDTLESPLADPPEIPLYLVPIAEQHAKALEVKKNVPVIVCLGNPPYDRHAAATTDNRAQTGGWVRWGDDLDGHRFVPGEGDTYDSVPPLLNDFIQPAVDAGHGVHIKNLYNLYIYFWRWALWKVFEQTPAAPGVVSFISASSYLDGDAFCGVREHMRRKCDEIWILDLGGEGRGTRKTDNVFAIQTPVAIAVAARSGEPDTEHPAAVHYCRIEGSEEAKLAALDAVEDLTSLEWKDCDDDWLAPFRPQGAGAYFAWPLLTDLMPWQHSGVQFKRTWPIAPDEDTLDRRWKALLGSTDRASTFKETRDRKVASKYPSLLDPNRKLEAIQDLKRSAQRPRAERYSYRSFDRQLALVDKRLGDFLRPVFWRIHSDQQLYLTSLLNHPLGRGPALTATASIPDLHHFRGSYGAKEVFPIFRENSGSEMNVAQGALGLLGEALDTSVNGEALTAYAYGILAQPAFTKRFRQELATRQLRVPITKDADLFDKVRQIGSRLLWLHTYGERFVPDGTPASSVPRGSAKCIEAVPGDEDGYPKDFAYNDSTRTLRVGKGAFAPVAPEVYGFEVSSLKVVQSWLKYRMKDGAGRKSSPLDDIRPKRWTGQFTTELLELLWVLEATLDTYPEQAELLEAVVDGDCFTADELPEVPDEMRKPPKEDTSPQMKIGE